MAKRSPRLTQLLTRERRLGLARLYAAHQAANETGRDPWAFACQLFLLEAEGVSATTLRWLVQNQLAEHRLEITKACDTERSFEPTYNQHFTSRRGREPVADRHCRGAGLQTGVDGTG